MTQKQLADALGIDASQVSRDEKNEYHEISTSRALKIPEALNAPIRIYHERS
ncbi:MAG: helix-turn-helix transcriptional regulator [Planctomycetales bacterium]|nr:helix-turn-helix transcriptional regulator [Planctomycetales bacterium]